MGNRDEVEIVLIEQIGSVEKDLQTKGFRLPIRYTMADGRTHDTQRQGLKREMVAFAASLPAPPQHPMSAYYYDGRFAGTVTRVRIGGAR